MTGLGEKRMGKKLHSVRLATEAGSGGPRQSCSTSSLTERAILLQLYAATGGPAGSWTDMTHWASDRSLAQWYGVFLDKTGQVESLMLAGNGLRGTLPAALGALPGLTTLDLYGNELTGGIPPSLGHLARLTFLDLGYNRLTGPIPATLGSLCHLRVLRLSHNQLTGKIPTVLGALPDLEVLQVEANRLQVPVPAALQQIPQLQIEPQRQASAR